MYFKEVKFFQYFITKNNKLLNKAFE